MLGEASRSMLAMVGILMAISMLQVLDKLLSFLHLKKMTQVMRYNGYMDDLARTSSMWTMGFSHVDFLNKVSL